MTGSQANRVSFYCQVSDVFISSNTTSAAISIPILCKLCASSLRTERIEVAFDVELAVEKVLTITLENPASPPQFSKGICTFARLLNFELKSTQTYQAWLLKKFAPH